MIPQLTVWADGVQPINADGLNTFLQTCDTVDDLRAFIGVTGMQVFMRGYSASGDGGQGNFYWNATGTGPDDDGVTNIVPYGAAAGCWTRLGTVLPQVAFTADLVNDQAISTGGAATLIVFSSFEFNTGGGYSTSTGVFTPTVAGLYLMSATAYYTGVTVAGHAVSLAIYRNGIASRVFNGAPLPAIGTTGALGSLTVTGLFRMNGSTDTIDVRSTATGLTSCSAVGSGVASYFSGALIGL